MKTKGFKKLKESEKLPCSGPAGATHQTADAVHMAAGQPLFATDGLGDDLDDGVIELDARASLDEYIEAAMWHREARLSGGDT